MATSRRRRSGPRGSSVTPNKFASYRVPRVVNLSSSDGAPPSTIRTKDRLGLEEPQQPESTLPVTVQDLPGGAIHSKNSHEHSVNPSGMYPHSDFESSWSPKVPANSPFGHGPACPVPQLGPEAQRMMSEIRTAALEIKTKLAAERDQQKLNTEVEPGRAGLRKIAKPKGKVGRFSDVHMAEFRKMDSIAGHPSAFRNQSIRSTPVKTGLKRTQSHLKLADDRRDFRENGQFGHKPRQLGASDRLENYASAKRPRAHITDDASSARTVSRTGKVSTTNRDDSSHPKTIIESSTARVASIKSPAGISIARLQVPQSRPQLASKSKRYTKPKPRTNIDIVRPTGTIERLKSILRIPSEDKGKAMPSTNFFSNRSSSGFGIDKPLPSLPFTPDGSKISGNIKNVRFPTVKVSLPESSTLVAHSSIKSAIPRLTPRKAPVLDSSPTNQIDQANPKPKGIYYPSLPGLIGDTVQHGFKDYPTLPEIEPVTDASRSPAPRCRLPLSEPSTFAFRSDHTINFGQSPNGFGSSPGQSSVRQVRSSLCPIMPGECSEINKENRDALELIPCPIIGKKRRRSHSINETGLEVEHLLKKHKPSHNEGPSTTSSIGERKTLGTLLKPVKEKRLRLSRLHMLAMPKIRK